MSMGPKRSLEAANAASMTAFLVISVTKVRIWRPGCLASISFLATARLVAVRPITLGYED